VSYSGVERPAHLRQEWSDLSYCSLPTPPLSQDRGHAACHCWREAKCRALQASGAKVPGGGLFDSGECPPTRRCRDLGQAHGWRENLWSSGLKSQATSAFCCGGVSAVMGSSDLNDHTLVSGARSGNQLSCSLPSEADRPIVGVACQAQFPVNTDEAETSSACRPCHAWTTTHVETPRQRNRSARDAW